MSDFTQYYDPKYKNLVAIYVSMDAIPAIIVILRFWSNYISTSHKSSFDDFLALITIPFVVTGTSVLHFSTRVMSRTIRSLDPDSPTPIQLGRIVELAQQQPELAFTIAVLSYVSIALPKLSALFFYHRKFGRSMKWFTHALWILGALNAIWLVLACTLSFFQCLPVSAIWNPVEAAGRTTCFESYAWFACSAVLAVTSTILDIAILVLPLPRLWRKQTSFLRKTLLTLCFSCGIGHHGFRAPGGITSKAWGLWMADTDQSVGPIPVHLLRPGRRLNFCYRRFAAPCFLLGQRFHKAGFRGLVKGGAPSISTVELSDGNSSESQNSRSPPVLLDGSSIQEMDGQCAPEMESQSRQEIDGRPRVEIGGSPRYELDGQSKA